MEVIELGLTIIACIDIDDPTATELETYFFQYIRCDIIIGNKNDGTAVNHLGSVANWMYLNPIPEHLE